MSLIHLVATLVALTPTEPAKPHPIRINLSAAGVAFVTNELPGLLPTELELPPLGYDLASCGGGESLGFLQRDTRIDLIIDSFSAHLTEDGALRAQLSLHGQAHGVAELQNIYACLDSAVCDDELILYGGSISVDFAPETDADGHPTLGVRSVDIDLPPANVTMQFSACSLDGVANWALDLVKEAALDYVHTFLEDLVHEWLAGTLNEQLALIKNFEGQVDFAQLKIAATEMDLSPAGLAMAGSIDLWTPYPLEGCAKVDPGEPRPYAVEPPTLSGTDHHAVMAVNLGLVQDALHHIWRQDLFCLSDRHIQALGVPFEMSLVTGMLPGFPPGTRARLQLLPRNEPKVTPLSGNGARLALEIKDFGASIIGERPDGGTTRIDIAVDARLGVAVNLSTALQALTANVLEVKIDRLEIQDGGLGIDAARLKTVLETIMLPPILEGLGEIRLVGVLLQLGEYFLLPSEMKTNSGWLAAGLRLFRAPSNDSTAPTTAVMTRPNGPVRPQNAKVVFSGGDDLTPPELLRYEISVDGVPRGTTSLRELLIGVPGVTGTHHVVARAVDLSGNKDSSPAILDVLVDGTAPRLLLLGDTARRIPSGEVTLDFQTSDDVSAAHELGAFVDIRRYADPTNMLTAESVATVSVPGGERSATFVLDPGVYQVALSVTDTAGNSATAYSTFVVDEAESCSSGTPSLWAALLAAVFVLRRKSRS